MNNTDLVKLLSWVIVELDNSKPNVKDMKKALDKALLHAIELEGKHQQAHSSLKRIAKVWGE